MGLVGVVVLSARSVQKREAVLFIQAQMDSSIVFITNDSFIGRFTT